MNALLKCTLLILTLGVANAATPSFSSFNTNQFSTNNLFISIKDGATITNTILRGQPSIPGTSFVFNGTTITNINQGSGGGADSLWTNIANVLQPLEGTSVLVTNLSSQDVLTALGAFRMTTSLVTNLVAGTNCVVPFNVGTISVAGSSADPDDSSLALATGNGQGQILVIQNASAGSGFTMLNGEPFCDGAPGSYTRLNGDWRPDTLGDALLLFNTGTIWTELGRASGNTNVVVDGVWRNIGGIISPVPENVNNQVWMMDPAIGVGDSISSLVIARDVGLDGFSMTRQKWYYSDATGDEVVSIAENSDDLSRVRGSINNQDVWEIGSTKTLGGYLTLNVNSGNYVNLNPGVLSSGTAVAHMFTTSENLGAVFGDKIMTIGKAGTNNIFQFFPEGVFQLESDEGPQIIGRSTPGLDNSFNFSAQPGFVYGDFYSGGNLVTSLSPDTASGAGRAYLLGTSQTYTNGDTYVSIENAVVPIFKFQPGPAGNPAGQITLGPGDTNVWMRVGTDVRYTNGVTTGVTIGVVDGAENLVGFGTDSGGNALVSSGTGKSVKLGPNNSGFIWFATDGNFYPTSTNGTMGLFSVNNRLGHIEQAGVHRSYGFMDATGTNYSRLAISHTGTNGLAILNSEGAGIAGAPKDLVIQSNATIVARVNMNSGYTGAGTKFLADDGNFKTANVSASVYDQLVHPHRADQVGAVLNTSDPSSVNYGHALFSGTAATNANFIEYRWQVPKNINTSVDLQASWSVMLNAADTDASTYTIGMASVAASSSYAAPTLGNYVTLTVAADASGAQNDYETVQDVTLTGWSAALTAGNVFVIRVARDGAGDTSNVAHYDVGLTIKYGVQ